MITVAAVLILLLGAAAFFAKTSDASYSGDSAAWEQAIADEGSQVGRMLLSISRRLSSLPSIYDAAASPQYRFIQERLLAAGGLYGSSVEVFLSLQAAVGFCALVILTGVWFAKVSIIFKVAGTLVALVFAVYPYGHISSKAKERAAAVTRALPEFAELLQMPLSVGTGVLPSLRFTAERLSGPVAEEVRNLLVVLDSRAMDDVQAFQLAGARLGTPDAGAFFNSLMAAHVEGDKLARNLASQAENLRIQAFNAARAENRKLPVRLVVLMAVHLLPMLFVVILMPTFMSLAHLGRG